jgi:hypothetical protein
MVPMLPRAKVKQGSNGGADPVVRCGRDTAKTIACGTTYGYNVVKEIRS